MISRSFDIQKERKVVFQCVERVGGLGQADLSLWSCRLSASQFLFLSLFRICICCLLISLLNFTLIGNFSFLFL